MNKPIFVSKAMKEANLPLGTPLNKYQPDWPAKPPGKRAPEADKWMLGGERCRCPTCGLYFNSVSGFDRHRVGKIGSPERRCLTDTELGAAGWTRGPKGHWLRPASASGWLRARLGTAEGDR
jgi:hypothetical protein